MPAFAFDRHGKSFSEGDFIKQCLPEAAGIMCAEKMQEINNVNMSRYTVAQRIKDFLVNLKHRTAVNFFAGS